MIARALLLAGLILVAAGGRAGAAGGLLVAAGDVTATTAVIWARGVRPGTLAIEYAAAGADAAAARTATLSVGADGLSMGKATLAELTPATRYLYRVRQDGQTAPGEFTTAPAAGDAATVSLLWSGDLGGAGFCRPTGGEYAIFRTMARRPADFFLFVGDTIYADSPCNKPGTVRGAETVATTLADMRARYLYHREDPALRDFLRKTPVWVIWDDHEVRNDFAGPSEAMMPAGRQAFQEAWPITIDPRQPTRLYRSFRWGRLLEVFILDTRQYRSNNRDPDGPGKTMLGAAQRRWLVEGVTASSATWKLVVSSVSLSVPTGRPERRDSWTGASVFGLTPDNPTGFATERDAILREFRTRAVRNLVFLTADVHHAELIRHHPHTEWSFHEFIAGPLSASTGRPRPLDDTLGPRSLFAQGGLNNFGEIAIEPAHLTVRFFDEQGGTLFTHTIGPE